MLPLVRLCTSSTSPCWNLRILHSDQVHVSRGCSGRMHSGWSAPFHFLKQKCSMIWIAREGRRSTARIVPALSPTPRATRFFRHNRRCWSIERGARETFSEDSRLVLLETEVCPRVSKLSYGRKLIARKGAPLTLGTNLLEHCFIQGLPRTRDSLHI